MAMSFKKAERKQSKLRLAISGPSGSGKTYAALLIAKGIGGRTAVIDTERGSASLYSHLHDFDVLELDPPFAPERFIEAIREAEKAGYDTIVIDSMTHEWDAAGGCLDSNDKASSKNGNSWQAWAKTTPRHQAFVDSILQSKANVIGTMRSKMETALDGGKVKKLGMKAIQREGMEYEFTVVFDLIHDGHLATPTKDRTGLFKDAHIITEDTGKRLLAWMQSGAAPTPVEAKPAPPVAQPAPDDGDYVPHDDEIDAVLASKESFASAWGEAKVSMLLVKDWVNIHFGSHHTTAEKISSYPMEQQRYVARILLLEAAQLRGE